METQPSYRLRLDQKDETARVRQLREAAKNLRSIVSQGSYSDEELRRFWALAENAGLILMASNSELAARAGVGGDFFLSVVRQRRRPKLPNFLKALTAIIDVADERLHDIDKGGSVSSNSSTAESTARTLRIEQDHAQLLPLARSLAEMARSEIGKLESERPNDPAAIERNDKQREILLIFADGFERIAAGLAVLAKDHGEPTFLRKASNAVNILSREVNAWFKKNRDEAVDWGIRLPILTAGVAVLGWAGANMTVATSTVAALVGGPKVMDVIRGKKNHNKPSPGQ